LGKKEKKNALCVGVFGRGVVGGGCVVFFWPGVAPGRRETGGPCLPQVVPAMPKKPKKGPGGEGPGRGGGKKRDNVADKKQKSTKKVGGGWGEKSYRNGGGGFQNGDRLTVFFIFCSRICFLLGFSEFLQS